MRLTATPVFDFLLGGGGGGGNACVGGVEMGNLN